MIFQNNILKTTAPVVKFYKVVFIALCGALLLFGCKKNSKDPVMLNELTITSIDNSSGKYNSSIIVTGKGFSTNLNEVQVTINGKIAELKKATPTELTVTVPKGSGSGLISVTVNGKTIKGPLFNYLFTAVVSTFAGNNKAATIDGTGINASFATPYGITIDRNGNIYVSDIGDNVIRKITPTGIVTTLAGSGKPGFSNGFGAQASFNTPYGLVADATGDIYVADGANRLIRKITPSGEVSTIAGNELSQPEVKDGTGSAASFLVPTSISMDESGALFVLDGKVRKITKDGVVTTIPFALDQSVFAIVADNKGGFYTANGLSYTVDKITSSGVKSVFAGSGKSGANNGSGTNASFSFVSGVAIDKLGNIIVADLYNALIRTITADGTVTTLAGKAGSSPPTVDGGDVEATLFNPVGIAIDPFGIIYIAEPNNHRIRKIVLE